MYTTTTRRDGNGEAIEGREQGVGD